MVTNLTANYTVLDRRMVSIEPTWRMRTAAICFWTFGWHPVSSRTSDAEPARESDISLITFHWPLIRVCHKTVVCVEELVAPRITWVKCWKWTNTNSDIDVTAGNATTPLWSISKPRMLKWARASVIENSSRKRLFQLTLFLEMTLKTTITEKKNIKQLGVDNWVNCCREAIQHIHYRLVTS